MGVALIALVLSGYPNEKQFENGNTGARRHLWTKEWSGFAPFITTVLGSQKNSRTLISSDARGEGMFISHLAHADHRSGDKRATVLRGSKELASTQWNGSAYAGKFATEFALMKWFTDSRIQFVIIDFSVPKSARRPYHDQLQLLAQTRPELFTEIATSPITRNGAQDASAKLYRVQLD
jgi:hypothetical protein